jgi:hypothetical protein
MNLSDVFTDLREIMIPYAEKLESTIDKDDELYINTNHKLANGKTLWFGGIKINKNYVSYHLMPIYLNPKLLEDVSPELKKHLHGKSCFNFTSSNATLFKELSVLTEACFNDYQKKGFLEDI